MNFTEKHTDYLQKHNESLAHFKDLALAKKRLSFWRWKASENLDKLLFEFDTNVKKTDGKLTWCPDNASTIETLNKHLKGFDKINFHRHIGLQSVLLDIDSDSIKSHQNADIVVTDAKFIIANTGNIYCSFYSIEEYLQVIQAKKVIIIAGIDTVLSHQNELPLYKLLYSVYETGSLSYPAELLCRPGKLRGFNGEIILIINDNNKSKLLEIPSHRPLFSLLNFTLPPVCPIQATENKGDNPKNLDSLQYFLYPFMNGLKTYSSIIYNNYGFKHLSEYLPYDLNLYEQVMDARASIKDDEKTSTFLSLLNPSSAQLATQPNKFSQATKFKKFATEQFFGPINS